MSSAVQIVRWQETLRLRLLPCHGIDVASTFIVAKHHGIWLDAGRRGQTVVAGYATGLNVGALRLHLLSVQEFGIRVKYELLLTAKPVVALVLAVPHICGVVILLKIARTRSPRLGLRELPLRLRLTIRVVVVLNPIAGVLALNPLVLFVY